MVFILRNILSLCSMIDSTDGSSTLRNPGKELIRQFVIYAEHKVGWLNDFVSMLKEQDIHILAISVLDTTDSAVIRLVTNYPKDLARFLKGQSISFTERLILAVELDEPSALLKLLTLSFVQRLISIMYTPLCINPMANRCLRSQWKTRILLKRLYVYIKFASLHKTSYPAKKH